MIDHAPRINAQRQAAQENAEMADMEKRAAPLHWALIIALVVVISSSLWDGWKHYADVAAQSEALVQCLNGRTIGIGGAVVRCEVRELVALGEVQP
ncbi:hypothetical protein Slit_0195 [Sideroxydans lithotrophicus ES-1]|uniref:Uncharacterized protein n=2 Tax=Sideroxydans TaxID=314343 RepID=D5CUA2_SIDLE|nr:hypothetical protein Slit_0195 [Sideroxydans lithotrophicus ES-1]